MGRCEFGSRSLNSGDTERPLDGVSATDADTCLLEDHALPSLSLKETGTTMKNFDAKDSAAKCEPVTATDNKHVDTQETSTWQANLPQSNLSFFVQRRRWKDGICRCQLTDSE